MKHFAQRAREHASHRAGAIPLNTILLLIITVLALIAVAWLILGPGRGDTEVIESLVSGDEAAALGVNQSEVIDATGRKDVQAELGRRYEVLIDDESDEGAAGVAHIGGLVVFVSGARKGDRAVIEIARMKRSSAEAVLVTKLKGDLKPIPISPGAPAPVDAGPLRSVSEPPVVGGRYRAVITDIGKKGDGITKVGGKVVFVPGTAKGEEVEFVITEDRERACQARLIAKSAGTPAAEPAKASAADGAVPGAEFDVVIKDKDRKTPDRDGVARIDGLVVFVPGTQPGDRVRIRITDRQPRFATAEVIERLSPEAGAADHGADPVR